MVLFLEFGENTKVKKSLLRLCGTHPTSRRCTKADNLKLDRYDVLFNLLLEGDLLISVSFLMDEIKFLPVYSTSNSSLQRKIFKKAVIPSIFPDIDRSRPELVIILELNHTFVNN